MTAWLSMIDTAPSGQALSHSPQAIQPYPQVLRTTSSSSSVEEHGIKLVASLGIMRIRPCGQTSSFCAVSAAVALFLVDDDTSVDQAHRMLLTDFDAGTDADAAALTFASCETALNRFLAGRASGEAFCPAAVPLQATNATVS